MADSETLIFSTDKMGSTKGGMDLYITRLSNGSWSDPVPLDFVNTPQDDQFVSASALGRYLIKEAPGSRKNSELVEFLFPEEVRPKGMMKVEGKITDENGAALPAYITIMDLVNSKRVHSARPTADGDISKAYEYGAAYITAASIAVTDPELFASWIVSYGREKMTLGADVVDINTKELLYRGWRHKTTLTLFEHLEYFYSRGLKYVKSTDVSRDGVLEGPAFSFYQEIRQAFPEICVLASGGVRGVDDIKRLNEMGIFAVIFGKAYYEGILDLKELEQFLVKKQV